MSNQSSNYKVLHEIGRGSFGDASICHQIQNPDQKYVIKRIKLDGLTPKDTVSAIQEAELLRQLSSPCIVKYIDSFVSNSHLSIVMEYCDGGDLSEFISKKQKAKSPFYENEIKNILYQMATALHHCHSHNILHRDVKTSNIFITSSSKNNQTVIKLGDFGVSRILNTAMSMAETQIGTPYYLSPEICKGQSYSYKSDIWSLGCVIYELMNMHRPFEGKHIASLVIAITTAKFKPLNKKFSKELRKLVLLMLSLNPKKRPLTEHILTHPSLSKMKQKYDKLWNVKRKSAGADDDVQGLTAQFNQLECLQNDLPRMSAMNSVKSISMCRNGNKLTEVPTTMPSESTDESDDIALRNISSAPGKMRKRRQGRGKLRPSKLEKIRSKGKKSKSPNPKTKAKKVISPEALRKIRMQKLEKQQAVHRKKAIERKQRKKDLREHIMQSRENSKGKEMQIEIIQSKYAQADDDFTQSKIFQPSQKAVKHSIMQMPSDYTVKQAMPANSYGTFNKIREKSEPKFISPVVSSSQQNDTINAIFRPSDKALKHSIMVQQSAKSKSAQKDTINEHYSQSAIFKPSAKAVKHSIMLPQPFQKQKTEAKIETSIIDTRLHGLEMHAQQYVNMMATEHRAELIRMQLEQELGFEIFRNVYLQAETIIGQDDYDIGALLPSDKQHLTDSFVKLLALERMK